MSPQPPLAIVESTDPMSLPRRVALVRPDMRPAVRQRQERYVMTFPHLIVREIVLFQVVVIFLSLAAIFFDAPLEGLANPVETPNPAKAPWYFLGLQELLHYFPPVVAGVVLPGLVVLALVVVPYARINLEAGPLWEDAPRARTIAVVLALFAIIGLFAAFLCWPIVVVTALVGLAMMAARRGAGGPTSSGARRFLAAVTLPEWIMTWFVLVGTVLTVIGTLFRGPGWSWVWPWHSSGG
jgi:menaquinol-cytochrome c reductase cytochrome b/c subunit